MQRLRLLCFSLLLLGHILDVYTGNNVLDCCLRTSEAPIPRRIVQDYRLQLVQDGCDIPAAVFITTKGKRLCAPLHSPWVIRLQERLDASSVKRDLAQKEAGAAMRGKLRLFCFTILCNSPPPLQNVGRSWQ
ncbi:C-C motif chemokine 19-like [Onychostruthus taczanowskii]|uniref:C-C motif chemokine 19-like n=1 Tax=Onychostruthus taczanowskii TaxID=356909 RepID=UPI001B807432|nr:C-C motif chemokine 19-like [Onychostruthus taczanowskii]